MSNTKTIEVPLTYDYNGKGHYAITEGKKSTVSLQANYACVEYDAEELAVFFESLLEAQRGFSPSTLLTAEADGIFTVKTFVDARGNEVDLGAQYASLFNIRSDGALSCSFEDEGDDFVSVLYTLPELLHSSGSAESSQPGSTV